MYTYTYICLHMVSGRFCGAAGAFLLRIPETSIGALDESQTGRWSLEVWLRLEINRRYELALFISESRPWNLEHKNIKHENARSVAELWRYSSTGIGVGVYTASFVLQILYLRFQGLDLSCYYSLRLRPYLWGPPLIIQGSCRLSMEVSGIPSRKSPVRAGDDQQCTSKGI